MVKSRERWEELKPEQLLVVVRLVSLILHFVDRCWLVQLYFYSEERLIQLHLMWKVFEEQPARLLLQLKLLQLLHWEQFEQLLQQALYDLELDVLVVFVELGCHNVVEDVHVDGEGVRVLALV